MMRPLSAVMAGLLCGVLGMRQARGIRRDCNILRRWEQLLQRVALLLQESLLPLPDVLDRAACEESPADALLRDLSAALRADPLASLSRLYIPHGAEGPVLVRLFSLLEQGSLDSRLLAVDIARRELSLLSESSQDKVRQDARMWSRLGWLCGACLTLMLL